MELYIQASKGPFIKQIVLISHHSKHTVINFGFLFLYKSQTMLTAYLHQNTSSFTHHLKQKKKK